MECEHLADACQQFGAGIDTSGVSALDILCGRASDGVELRHLQRGRQIVEELATREIDAPRFRAYLDLFEGGEADPQWKPMSAELDGIACDLRSDRAGSRQRKSSLTAEEQARVAALWSRVESMIDARYPERAITRKRKNKDPESLKEDGRREEAKSAAVVLICEAVADGVPDEHVLNRVSSRLLNHDWKEHKVRHPKARRHESTRKPEETREEAEARLSRAWREDKPVLNIDAEDSETGEWCHDVGDGKNPREHEAHREDLAAALQLLPSSDRQLFVSHFVDDKTLSDVAAQTGMSVKKARLVIARCKEVLRSALSGYAPDPVE